jgi:hypothetical protein
MGGPYRTHGEPRYFNLKLSDKRHFVKACCILKDDIKLDLRVMKSENMDWIQVGQRVQWRTVVSTVLHLDFRKNMEFLKQLN